MDPKISQSLKELKSWISDVNPDALLVDGFDGAILGIAEKCGSPPVIVYDYYKCCDEENSNRMACLAVKIIITYFYNFPLFFEGTTGEYIQYLIHGRSVPNTKKNQETQENPEM